MIISDFFSIFDIADDCILGCDFLSKTEITESINKIFQNTPSTIDSNADEQGYVGLWSGLRNYQICCKMSSKIILRI